MKTNTPTLFNQNQNIADKFTPSESVVVYPGDCLDLLRSIPDESFQLIVTSPPYNIGKEYEKKLHLDVYLEQQTQIITECVRALSPKGSICWQVGNYVDRGAIIPLDTVLYPTFSRLGLRMRNQIIWHFEHGLHCSRRFSGQYETIIWFTKSDDYIFHLDPVRIPQKYPGKKYFKGPKAGQYSCNPLGKNPGDLWVIPNVKSNHVEKTEHPWRKIGYLFHSLERARRPSLPFVMDAEVWARRPSRNTSILHETEFGRKSKAHCELAPWTDPFMTLLKTGTALRWHLGIRRIWADDIA